MMVGLRKMIVVIVVLGIAALVEMNEFRAAILETVLLTFVAGNVVEHISKGGVGEKVVGIIDSFRKPGTGSAGDEEAK